MQITFIEKNPDATLGFTGHVVSPEHPLPVTVVAEGGVPVTGIGGGGAGPDGEIAVGRETLTITTTGTTEPGVDYTFIDVKVTTESTVTIQLPAAADYGFGRLLYIKDKSGTLPAGEAGNTNNRIEIVAVVGEQIDGHGRYYTMNQQDQYLVLKATAAGTEQAWQIVGEAPPRNIYTGFANLIFNNADYDVVSNIDLQGPHAYIPVGYELYTSYRDQTWWLRFYATEADRTADGTRTHGTAPDPGINAPTELVVGGTAPYKSLNTYGGPNIMTSWNADGTARNVVFMSARQLAGPLPGRLTGSVMYYELNRSR